MASSGHDEETDCFFELDSSQPLTLNTSAAEEMQTLFHFLLFRISSFVFLLAFFPFEPFSPFAFVISSDWTLLLFCLGSALGFGQTPSSNVLSSEI